MNIFQVLKIEENYFYKINYSKKKLQIKLQNQTKLSLANIKIKIYHSVILQSNKNVMLFPVKQMLKTKIIKNKIIQ